MKILRQLLFIAFIMIGASAATFAQNNDNRRTPPKEGPQPKVVVKPKDDDKNKPKEDRPRNDNRGNNNRGRRPDNEE